MDRAMPLASGAEFIMKRLSDRGFCAYVVGGSVRDFLRGVEPADYDMATDSSPAQLCEIFSDVKTVKTGLKHGTLTIIVDSVPYEVTTFRKDGNYTDNRHPDSVTFTESISEDLSRRDFTINAIAYSIDTGFVDLFSGISDIKLGVVRAVGDPEVRFSEDSLRILRGMRFASVLNFVVEEKTKTAIYKLANLLKNVSCERIFTEWKKLLSGAGAYKIISEFKDVIAVFMPELSELEMPIEQSFTEMDSSVRELALFFTKDKAAQRYFSAMKRLKSDNKRREFGTLVLENADRPLKTLADMGLSLLEMGEKGTAALITLKDAFFGDGQNMWELYQTLLSDSAGVCFKLSELEINGEDLASLGYKGKEIGKALDIALKGTATGAVKNTKHDLIAFLENNR